MARKKSYKLLPLIRISQVVRILAPLSIFKFPLLATIISFTLDMADSPIYRFAGYTRKEYQPIDKTLDFYWYAVSFTFAWLANFPFLPLLAALLIIRLIGQVLFYTTKNEKYFIFFPNFYETMFILILLSTILEGLKFLTFPENIFKVTTLVVIFTVPKEVIAHKLDKFYYPFIPEFFKGPE